ncbi:hypothetical protein FHW67_000772 [Herbaspirillum sp. Sphag1AN]|uniref:InvB/SpaK family type III secretion system chaperone n=1 Tax=unclassified Herbaspirillum TaxID=2624150 RepID=UPI00161B7115|nr:MULTISPECIES: hypothetical protein [unclassified Herbaspirillum]MBB3211524.1 hypothetical protein [Herbaspirillum sp. Sphag1AN]MBB3245210.1 hypothetical protein [Herbaspirillum sp. Sphag64]
MNNQTLAELVKDALLETGCDPSLIQKLDQHATVQIELNDSPSLYIGKTDERVVIWSDLCDFHESIVRHSSEPLLQEIMLGFPYGLNQQIVLRESEGRLQLYSNISEEFLENAQRMSEAINAFFERQTRFLEIIRQ